jgi:hypothetical protein
MCGKKRDQKKGITDMDGMAETSMGGCDCGVRRGISPELYIKNSAFTNRMSQRAQDWGKGSDLSSETVRYEDVDSVHVRKKTDRDL